MQKQNQDVSFLKEILIAPSSKLITDRFAAHSSEAGCNGQCRTGSCNPIAPLF